MPLKKNDDFKSPIVFGLQKRGSRKIGMFLNMQDLSILRLSGTQSRDCLWGLSPSPVSGCQPSSLLSSCHLPRVLSNSFQLDASRGPRAGKARSLWTECESSIGDNGRGSLLASGTIIQCFRSRSPSFWEAVPSTCSAALNSALALTGWATLNIAHLNLSKSLFPQLQNEENQSTYPRSNITPHGKGLSGPWYPECTGQELSRWSWDG